LVENAATKTATIVNIPVDTKMYMAVKKQSLLFDAKYLNHLENIA